MMMKKMKTNIVLALTLYLWSLSILLSSASSSSLVEKTPPSQIVLYLHIYRDINFVEFASTNTSAIVAGSNGLSYTPVDGILRAIDVPVSMDPSPSSKLIGAAHGLAFEVFPGSIKSGSTGGMGSDASSVYPPSRESLFETIEYDDGEFQGTIAIHGQMSFPPMPNDEVAVVGGTRSFRCVQGYGLPALVGGSSTTPYVLFRWDLRLFYPPYCK